MARGVVNIQTTYFLPFFKSVVIILGLLVKYEYICSHSDDSDV